MDNYDDCQKTCGGVTCGNSAGECYDELGRACTRYKQACSDPFTRDKCKKTCDRCGDVPEDCYDELSINYCRRDYACTHPYMAPRCALTCDRCGKVPPGSGEDIDDGESPEENTDPSA